MILIQKIVISFDNATLLEENYNGEDREMDVYICDEKSHNTEEQDIKMVVDEEFTTLLYKNYDGQINNKIIIKCKSWRNNDKIFVCNIQKYSGKVNINFTNNKFSIIYAYE